MDKNNHEKKDQKLPEEMLTESDVLNLIENAENVRDKAIIALLWDIGARTFKISNKQIALTNLGTVAFYWTDNGNWNLWKTANLGLLPVSEKLYSGSSNIRFKIVVKPVNGAYINAKVTIT
ncbi:hypothetical protein [Methanosarcina sp. WWM596]|uniref:hypothetical protein n=1 Tax=Methanosarcina sp. WWM596 TaxID=1434103 RepID=UPI00064F2C89|nr:hypothetical protein [Methanosarcina sp. WWM596]